MKNLVPAGMNIRIDKKSAVYKKTNGLCFYCGNPGETLDHVVPKKKGGSNENFNLIAACKVCNHSKGSKSAEHYRRMKSSSHRAGDELQSWIARFAEVCSEHQQNEIRKIIVDLLSRPLPVFFGENLGIKIAEVLGKRRAA